MPDHRPTVARLWRGWTTPDMADAYERLLRETILPGIQARLPDGYHGAWLLRRDAGEEVEFATLLLFRDLATVRRFAGDDHEAAVVPDTARRLLRRFDERAAHFETLLEPGAG